MICFGYATNYNTQRAFAIIFLICSDLLNCLRSTGTIVVTTESVFTMKFFTETVKAAIFAVLMYSLYGHCVNITFKRKYQQNDPCFQTIFPFLTTMKWHDMTWHVKIHGFLNISTKVSPKHYYLWKNKIPLQPNILGNNILHPNSRNWLEPNLVTKWYIFLLIQLTLNNSNSHGTLKNVRPIKSSSFRKVW